MAWNILMIPIIGGLIGWITNKLAIRMLFRPKEPLSVPMTSWSIQGVLPRRKEDIAQAIGHTVEKDLMSAEMLIDQLKNNQYKKEIVEAATTHMVDKFKNSMPYIIPNSLITILVRHITPSIKNEVEKLVGQMETTVYSRLKDDLNVADIVRRKISLMNLEEVEQMAVNVVSSELRYIELFGALLGVIIGFVQVLFIYLVF